MMDRIKCRLPLSTGDSFDDMKPAFKFIDVALIVPIDIINIAQYETLWNRLTARNRDRTFYL